MPPAFTLYFRCSQCRFSLQAYGSAALRHRAISKRADDIEDQFTKRTSDIWHDDPECSRTEALRKTGLENSHLFEALRSV
jgi:hypothetical protein